MNSILGRDTLSLGPANLYVKKRFVAGVETDWESATGWTYLGLTESAVFRSSTTKTDLSASQRGTRAADKAVSAQNVQIEVGLGQPTLERLEIIQQGLKLERDPGTGEITQWKIVSVLGERDSDAAVEMWLKFVEIDRGSEMPGKTHTVYAKASPATESVELTFDAAAQRFFSVMFEAYLNDSGLYPVSFVSGSVTQYAYAWSAE